MCILFVCFLFCCRTWHDATAHFLCVCLPGWQLQKLIPTIYSVSEHTTILQRLMELYIMLLQEMPPQSYNQAAIWQSTSSTKQQLQRVRWLDSCPVLREHQGGHTKILFAGSVICIFVIGGWIIFKQLVYASEVNLLLIDSQLVWRRERLAVHLCSRVLLPQCVELWTLLAIMWTCNLLT